MDQLSVELVEMTNTVARFRTFFLGGWHFISISVGDFTREELFERARNGLQAALWHQHLANSV